MPTFTFNKTEKLKSRKLIDQLFASASALQAYPIRLLYQQVPLPPGVCLQATVSVSKRSFKKAVDRNRVKRLMREVYRLHKLPLQQQLAAKKVELALFFIYTAKDIVPFSQLEKAMIAVLKKLAQVPFVEDKAAQ